MAETATAAMSSMDNQSAPWMVALAEQQKIIQKLMERIEILEGGKADPQNSTSDVSSGLGQASTLQPNTAVSRQSREWSQPEHRASSLHSGRASTSPVSSYARPPNPNRPQSTHTTGAASVTSRASGGGSSAASAAGDAGRSKSTASEGKSNQPLCKFGRKCIRQDCWFQHPDGTQVNSTEASSSDTTSTRPKKSCFKGMSCSRSNCRYEHPDGWNPYSATSELPAQAEPSSSSSQQTVDTWAPAEDSNGGWDSAPNLSSWAETPATNDWGTPASDWGPTPTANNTWDTTANQTQDAASQPQDVSSQLQDPPSRTQDPPPQSQWGEVSSSGWGEVTSSGWGEVTSSGWGADNGEVETVTSQASSTPTPGSSSKGKGKNAGKKKRELGRLARRQAEKDAQLAYEAATTSTSVPSEHPTPVLSPELAHDRSDNLTNESALEPADDAVPIESTRESTNVSVDEPAEAPVDELAPEPTIDFADEPTYEPVQEPVQESSVELAVEPVVEPAVESVVESVESVEPHDPVNTSLMAAETPDMQETPPLEPSASSPMLSPSESDMPETPNRLVWSDEPQEDCPVVDFADLPSSHDPSEYVEDVEGYVPEPVEEPSLDNTQSMIYSTWENVAPSAADWGFDTSEFDTPAPDPVPTPTPAPVIVDPRPPKKSVKLKGKQKAIGKTSNAFNYQPQNIGAPRSSSHKPVSNATPLPAPRMAPPVMPESEPEPEPAIVAPEPPKGIPEEEIPDWLLGGGVDAHAVLGISRPTTPEPRASSNSTPQPIGPPKMSRMAGSKFPGLGETVLPKPQPKTTPAPKPVVRARPVGWKVVDNPNPPGTSAWATGSNNVTPTTKGKRTVRPKTKK